jgi:membrane fusion protein (multidrug efflux system)
MGTNAKSRRSSYSSPILSISLFCLLTACSKGDKPSPANTPNGGMPPAQVSVIEVSAHTVPATYEYTAQISAIRDVEIRARVAGILLKRTYQEGGQVNAGQPLFQIDPAQYQTVLNSAEAGLASAEARAGQARNQLNRVKPLQETKAVSQREIDDAASAVQVAEADIKTARAKLAEAQLNLRYTKVESPVTGIASRSQKSEGSLISGPDILLTTVSQVDKVYVLFGIPDIEQQRIRSDVDAGRLTLPKDGKLDVTVSTADGAVYEHKGKVSFSDIRVNTSTGTVEARAELPNPDLKLRPGQFAKVILSGAERPNAIVVPQRSVLEGPAGKFVYVVNAKNSAEAKPVKVGDWVNETWVIQSGLATGDKVIVDGVMKIGPGAPVQIAALPSKPADPKPAEVK